MVKNYNIIRNNAKNEYGTSILIRNNIPINGITFDTESTIIKFNTEKTTVVNVYDDS